MPDHHHEQTVPKGALIGAAILIVATLGLATGARQMHLAHPEAAAPPALEAIDVRFEDRPDGTLAVLDAETGRQVSAVPPGTNGFIRGVLRGMVRGRKLDALDRGGEFRLSREADGRLTLQDPENGRRIDLDSFGPTNSAAFGHLLAAGRGRP